MLRHNEPTWMPKVDGHAGLSIGVGVAREQLVCHTGTTDRNLPNRRHTVHRHGRHTRCGLWLQHVGPQLGRGRSRRGRGWCRSCGCAARLFLGCLLDVRLLRLCSLLLRGEIILHQQVPHLSSMANLCITERRGDVTGRVVTYLLHCGEFWLDGEVFRGLDLCNLVGEVGAYMARGQ
jgi:hypothetical protein